MNNEEFTLQKGDVIESGSVQWLYDGEPQWIIINDLSKFRKVSRTSCDTGHTVDLSDFDVWRNGEKVCAEVPVEPDTEWIGLGMDDAIKILIGKGFGVIPKLTGCYITFDGESVFRSNEGVIQMARTKKIPLPESEWIECEPKDADAIKVGGQLFPLKNKPDMGYTYPFQFETCGFTDLLAKEFEATFYRRRKVEPVVIEWNFGGSGEFRDRKMGIAHEIDITKPFKVTFEQEVVK